MLDFFSKLFGSKSERDVKSIQPLVEKIKAEFAKLDNQLIYDALMGRFDPDLVKMQFQTEVINLGYKASAYFNKYPGRFISAHLSDWTADRKEVPIGQGIIDWKEFFASAKTGGVQNFFVEMKFDNLKESATYIHQLQPAS